MRATFLGGPRHGQTVDMDPAPNRLWVDNPDGSKFLYSVKSEDLEAVGTRPLKTRHTWYAKANIEDEEFYELRDSIPQPDID
jgi:hypothetical protein